MSVFRTSSFATLARGLLLAVTAVLAAALGLVVTGSPVSGAPAAQTAGRRSTLAVTYGEGSSTRVDMLGAASKPGVLGSADVKRTQGRTRVRLHIDALPHPQSFGSFYTTYLLWAVAPEGQAASLAELPHSKGVEMEVTTSFQTFGLIVTAEPHSAVALPSPLILAENAARHDTVGHFKTSSLEYGGAVGSLYLAPGPADFVRRDYSTPLLVLGGHRAVDLAKGAGAGQYSAKELQQAELKLVTLDRAWTRKGKLPKALEAEAREVMRMAEHARSVAEAGREQDRLAAERRATSAQVARAQSTADRARDEAEEARARAERERERASEARSDADRARVAEQQAHALKDLAMLQADKARADAEEARRDKEKMQQQLFQSISTILETRREARGLIVNLSDVLFDFDRATLTPGAREKLSKLAGILLAYPGRYQLGVEGHTDSIGSHEYNLGLSVGRAESVRSYLLGAGVPLERMGTAIGFGDGRPVASNASAPGRQMNRRVEIVIADVSS